VLSHISQPVQDILHQKPKVDITKIEQVIRDNYDTRFLSETVEELIELIRWQEKEIERLRKEGGE
jgi:hypothetical protein